MKVKALRALRCADYDERHKTNERIEGLYEGGHEWREHLTYWLPKSEVEPGSLLKERHIRATYEPLLPVVVNLTLGAMFAEAPVIEGLPPDLWERLEQDVDGAGTSAVEFFKHAAKHAILYRQAMTWIEVPRAEVVEVTAADSMARLQRIYLRQIEPETIQATMYDARGKLSGVLLEEEVIERTDIAAPPVRKVRWTAVDAERIRAWEWTPQRPDQKDPDENDDAPQVMDVAHGYGFMPIEELRIPTDQSLGWRLLDPCTAHCRAANELDWALYRSATELLVIVAAGEVPPVSTGHGFYLKLNRDTMGSGSDRAEYVGPSGASLDKLAQREADARTAVYRAAQHLQMASDPNASAAKQSAESKARDAEATAILLDSYGDLLRDYITEVLRKVARLVGSDEAAVVVTGLQGKERTDPAAVLKAHTMAGDLMNASPTARAEMLVQQANALLPDLAPDTMAKIRAEIEADVSRTPPGAGGVADQPQKPAPPDPNAPPDPIAG